MMKAAGLAAAVMTCAVFAGREADGQTTAPTTQPAQSASDYILTPPAPHTPRINGPRIYGERTGKPFLYHVPVTGDRPIQIAADGLPDGLTLDAKTGLVTGRVAKAGTYDIKLSASNSLGETHAPLRIVIGDRIALTPALGWNSWNYFGRRVDDGKVRQAANAMVSSGLVNHGWTYINIDDCWQGERDDQGEIQGNKKFPDMHALCDFIHAKGLKAGIYSSPGARTCAGFTGTLGHEDQDAQTYANWGYDYVKYDWCSYESVYRQQLGQKLADALPADKDKILALIDERSKLPPTPRVNGRRVPSTREAEIVAELDNYQKQIPPEKLADIIKELRQVPYRRFRHSLDLVDRDLVYSLCQYGQSDVWTWGDEIGGNSWRTTGDINATWRRIDEIGFSQSKLAPYAGPGHWNDPDMLEVGNGNLTPNEMYTHMSLWAMLSSPLLIGCDMTRMSPLTISIFSNDEVLAIDQDPLGQQATMVWQDGKLNAWTKDLADGSKAVALFNEDNQQQTTTIPWYRLKLEGKQRLRDPWQQKDLGVADANFSAAIPAHGVVLLVMSKAQ